jgi:hypothetical protein
VVQCAINFIYICSFANRIRSALKHALVPAIYRILDRRSPAEDKIEKCCNGGQIGLGVYMFDANPAVGNVGYSREDRGAEAELYASKQGPMVTRRCSNVGRP